MSIVNGLNHCKLLFGGGKHLQGHLQGLIVKDFNDLVSVEKANDSNDGRAILLNKKW